MNSKHILTNVLIGTLSIGSISAKSKKDEAPNLLYIFPDQYRMMALSLWSSPEYQKYLSTKGDPVITPNLDKLAKQSAILTNASSIHPVSSPHRAMLMSGMYPANNGVEDMNCYKGKKQGLHNNIECFTDVLYKAGYETAYIGKTHWERTEPLFCKDGNYVGQTQEPGGHYMNPYDTYIPEGRGRHSNKFWFQQLTDNHFDTKCFSNIPELVGGKKDGELYRPKRFTTEVEADIIVQYLENKNGERDASKPFSLMWSINPPHNPYSKISDCKKEVFDKYFKDIPTSEILYRANLDLENKNGNTNWKSSKQLELSTRIYYSLIKSIDDEIGRVLETLDKCKLTDNTMIVFTTDHGDMMGSHGLSGKNQIYDESFIVPFLIKYPKKIKHHVNDIMFSTVDIMPTMLGIMGLGDKIPATVEGVNYSEVFLTGKYKKCKKPESALYLHMNKKGVRTYEYTYVVEKNGSYKLFNNKKDPYQITSLDINSIPEKDAVFLKKSLGDWLAKASDKWAKNKTNEGLIIYQ